MHFLFLFLSLSSCSFLYYSRRNKVYWTTAASSITKRMQQRYKNLHGCSFYFSDGSLKAVLKVARYVPRKVKMRLNPDRCASLSRKCSANTVLWASYCRLDTVCSFVGRPRSRARATTRALTRFLDETSWNSSTVAVHPRSYSPNSLTRALYSWPSCELASGSRIICYNNNSCRSQA